MTNLRLILSKSKSVHVMSSAVPTEFVGGGVSKKRLRAEDGGNQKIASVRTDDYPDQKILKELVAKSFYIGDHYGEWRKRGMRVFGVSYVYSLLNELSCELIGEDKSIKTLDDVRVCVENYISADLTHTLPSNHGSLVVDACQFIFQTFRNVLRGDKPWGAPLHGYFSVALTTLPMVYDSPISSSLELFVGLNAQVLADKDAQFLYQREFPCGGYMFLLKGMMSALQESICIRQQTSKHAMLEKLHERFADYVGNDTVLLETVDLNLRWKRMQLDSLQKKKMEVDIKYALLSKRKQECEDRKLGFEQDIKEVNIRESNLVEAGPLLEISKKIMQESELSKLIANGKQFLDGAKASLKSKILDEDNTLRDLNTKMVQKENLFDCVFSGEANVIAPGEKTKYSMLEMDIARHNDAVSMLESLVSSSVLWKDNSTIIKESMQEAFKEQVGKLEPLIRLASQESCVEAVISWIRKMISSKEMLFEASFYMMDEIRNKLA